jgi:outer membrane protein OmpA-like peptidoglycan-associated protein
MEARDNVEPGSKIIVIGSGLSDSGDLNFSKNGILTGEEARTQAIEAIKNKYDADHLDGYTVEFYGLGDTSVPQEPLSSIQKGIVRDIYKDAIRGLGGTTVINTDTQTGAPVATNYVVGTTDTGCGEIKLVFDDDDLKFVGDKAIFVDQAAAVKALSSIREIWGKQQDTIETIQIDGYTAHYPGADALSQERANAVKTALVGLGVSSDKVTATGRGFGPYETDTQNRTVKVNISRSSQQCNN